MVIVYRYVYSMLVLFSKFKGVDGLILFDVVGVNGFDEINIEFIIFYVIFVLMFLFIYNNFFFLRC